MAFIDPVSAWFQRSERVNMRRAPGGRQPKERASQGARREREGQHSHVGRQVERHDLITSRHEADEDATPPMSEEQPRGGAREREQNTFGQQLPDQSGPACAPRQPHPHLVAPGGATRQEQVRDVGAGNQQYDANNGHENEQRLAISPAETLEPFRERRDAESGFTILRHRLRSRICWECGLKYGWRERRQPRAALLQGDAGFETADDPPAPVVAANNRPGALRRPNWRVIPILNANERRLGHAHDLEWTAIDGDRFADDVRAAAILALPERMGDDGDRGTAPLIVGVREVTTKDRTHAERREEAPAHEADADRARLAAGAEIGGARRAVDAHS